MIETKSGIISLMNAQIILVIGVTLLYLVRFRPSVIRRIIINKEINKRLFAQELIIFIFVILQFFGLTFGTLTNQAWVPVFGLVLFIGGGLFSLYSRFVLKDNYMPAISAKLPTTLQTTGPFKIVRHPIYLGTLAGFIGMELVFNSPLILMAIIVFILCLKQSKKEEKLLALKYGEAWTTYEKKTPYKLIPFVY